ncbi:MAG: Acyl-CoA carboxylase epsilon subunit [Frankiales bacterium]|nr:Acyl-CoA carboxylase epsilon subunit [Frankiales bacterium]
MSAELRVIRGDATPEELAAVVALLAASGGGEAPEEPAPPSVWGRPQLRAPLPAPGPGAWVASGLRL